MENENFEISYATLWKSIIRPPRDDYDEDQLGDDVFIYRDITYIRKDYKILNKQGNFIRASFIEPDEESRVKINLLNCSQDS